MGDYKSNEAGFGANIKEKASTGSKDVRRMGFNAVLPEPENAWKQAARNAYVNAKDCTNGLLGLISDVEHRLIRKPKVAAAIAASMLATGAVVVYPERTGEMVGHLAGGFEAGAHGQPYCHDTGADCPTSRIVGENIGTIHFNLTEGFANTRAAFPHETADGTLSFDSRVPAPKTPEP